MAELFPGSLIITTDSLLDAFEADISALHDASDERVFAAFQRVALAPNTVNDGHDGAAYETDEREQCATTSTKPSPSRERMSSL